MRSKIGGNRSVSQRSDGSVGSQIKSYSSKNFHLRNKWRLPSFEPCSGDLNVIKFFFLSLHQVGISHTLPCYVTLSGRGCSMVAIKTLYTLPSANQNSIYIDPVRAKTLYTLASAKQNSIHIAGPGLETLYTLSQPEQKLHIHWAIAGPQWMLVRCLKKSHRKKKWHWFTAGVTKWLLKYHFIIIWVYYNYTTLITCKTAKLLFLNGKKVKCWRFHTAGVASSKLASPTKKFPMKSST